MEPDAAFRLIRQVVGESLWIHRRDPARGHLADPVRTLCGLRRAPKPLTSAHGAPYTLKRNSTTSPSRITYSLPSTRALPAERTAARDPASTRSSYPTISALMKPRSKSVWMVPAAWGAVSPMWMVQARDSLGPAVRKVWRPR